MKLNQCSGWYYINLQLIKTRELSTFNFNILLSNKGPEGESLPGFFLHFCIGNSRVQYRLPCLEQCPRGPVVRGSDADTVCIDFQARNIDFKF